MKYWFLVQKEYLTDRLIAQSYKDRFNVKGIRNNDFIHYSESLRAIEDITQNEEATYILLPLNSFFHDDLQGLIAYSGSELIDILKQNNWAHNQ